MTRTLLMLVSLSAVPALLAGQSSGALDPKLLLEPLSESWPVYSGDYSGKRFSALTQINRSTVKHLTLSWLTRVTGGSGAGRGGRGGVGTIEYAGSTLPGSNLVGSRVPFVSAAGHAW